MVVTREHISRIFNMREILLTFQTGFNLVDAAVVCAILGSIFADDINGLAGEEEELANLVEHLDKASTAYGIEISAEKTKLMTNNTSGINTEIKVNGQKFETVTSFKYLGSVITDVGSKPGYSPG